MLIFFINKIKGDINKNKYYKLYEYKYKYLESTHCKQEPELGKYVQGNKGHKVER